MESEFGSPVIGRPTVDHRRGTDWALALALVRLARGHNDEARPAALDTVNGEGTAMNSQSSSCWGLNPKSEPRLCSSGTVEKERKRHDGPA